MYPPPLRLRPLLCAFALASVAIACKPRHPRVDVDEENWSRRKVELPGRDSMVRGKSYLSIYSQFYSITQHQRYNLTSTASMRNVSESDTVYLTRADYYDTHGIKIRTYFDYPIYLLPMETLEIIIAEKDIEGGTGSNFLFEWTTSVICPEPLFEGLMISMEGAQGISFTTRARRVE